MQNFCLCKDMLLRRQHSIVVRNVPSVETAIRVKRIKLFSKMFTFVWTQSVVHSGRPCLTQSVTSVVTVLFFSPTPPTSRISTVMWTPSKRDVMHGWPPWTCTQARRSRPILQLTLSYLFWECLKAFSSNRLSHARSMLRTESCTENA